METRPLPLSREADRCLTACPKCARVMQARWLRYAHRCRGDLQAREQDAVDRAHEAFRQREASQKPASAATAAPQSARRYPSDQRNDREAAAAKYGHLFSGLRHA